MNEQNRGSYDQRLKDHLAGYKKNVLGVAGNGTWRDHRGTERSYGHILPLDRQERNILEPYRDEFWDYWAAQKK